MTNKNLYNYGRSGWNRRGPTDAEIMELARVRSEVLDPDSYYWQNQVRNVKHALEEIMGPDDFENWAEARYPGPSIEQESWKEIYLAFVVKLEDLTDGESGSEFHDWRNDPKHYRMAGGDHGSIK